MPCTNNKSARDMRNRIFLEVFIMQLGSSLVGTHLLTKNDEWWIKKSLWQASTHVHYLKNLEITMAGSERTMKRFK